MGSGEELAAWELCSCLSSLLKDIAAETEDRRRRKQVIHIRDHCHDDSHDISVIMTLLIKLCRQKERQTNCQTKLEVLMKMS